MARIIPIRDLRKGAEISEFVRSSGEPVFVTRNGYGDMVIMSMEAYEKGFAESMIAGLLKAAQEIKSGSAKMISADDAFAKLEEKYAAK